MSQLSDFADASFLRVFTAPRRLSPEEQGLVRERLEAFFRGWASHEVPVTGACEFVRDRFLVVAADEARGPISGCSKDSLVGAVRELGREFGIDLVASAPVCWLEDDEVRTADRATFGRLVEEGRIGAETPVFDTTIHQVRAFRDGLFELPARDSWHARAWDLTARA